MPINIDDLEFAAPAPDENVLLVDEALKRLEAEDPKIASSFPPLSSPRKGPRS